jgi:hypothetical protein
VVPVSFDLFRTLVRVDGPDEPATAEAREWTVQEPPRAAHPVALRYAEAPLPESSGDAEYAVVTDLDTEVRQP